MCKTILGYILSILTLSSFGKEDVKWSVVLEEPGKKEVEICHFDGLPKDSIAFNKTVNGIHVNVKIKNENNLFAYCAEAASESDKRCFLSLRFNYGYGEVFSYNGIVKENEIFRQSPHDPANHVFPWLVKQAVPMIALKNKGRTIVAISNSPAFYDNYTTQYFDIQNKQISISSGDNGVAGGSDSTRVKIESYYHCIGKNQSHVFEGIMIKSNSGNLSDLRKDVLMAIAKRWGNRVEDRFGATAFSTNYMLLRKNETGKSRYWVVPGIEYANKQYSRDAFWQSMVLPANFSRECYLNEARSQTPGAERPLFCMIWAYRTKLEGGLPDMEAAKRTLAYIEEHATGGWYHSSFQKGKKDFQSWKDLVAFEESDVISYNQGLLAVALMSAEALGLKSSVTSQKAIQNYQSLFKKEGGYFPLSKEKDLLSVDPLVGDLLSQLYFNRPLLSKESVISHYKNVISKAKTKYGYKVSCLPNGDFAPIRLYSATGHELTGKEQGDYQFGGSWFLYDMLFLVDSYLHGAPGALDELKWRGSLDFKLGGTYFEYINTIKGTPDKANQGWDAAIYAIWRKLTEQGKADQSFLRKINDL